MRSICRRDKPKRQATADTDYPASSAAMIAVFQSWRLACGDADCARRMMCLMVRLTSLNSWATVRIDWPLCTKAVIASSRFLFTYPPRLTAGFASSLAPGRLLL